ncbi:MAG: hypothetical protein KA140_05640 [Caldisericia bacterium]|nr:hypothetical protein [Caldisericia bacterium]
MKGKLGILVTALILSIAFVSPVFATLGPIRVELNMIKPRLSAARANRITAFKVYIRYNVNIKIHDWFKIWFPIDENGLTDNPEEIASKICDGFQKIDEKISDPRFVPNEEYFKKFDNLELKKTGKMYAITGEKGYGEFYNIPASENVTNWGDICNIGKSIPRVVKDPSGLGFWMLGTIMPAMPFDDKDRKKALESLDSSTSIGYSPCGICSGYPRVINNCIERSLLLYTPLEVEAWRKGYNSIDINTSKTTGIIGPATPGRYRLAVATTPEPVPVESESFILPCSDVSDVTLEDNLMNNSSNALTVNFKTGEGGALDGGSSTIMLKLPATFVIPKRFAAKSIKINGAFVQSPPEITQSVGFAEMSIVCPTDVNNLGKAKIEFLSNSGIACKLTRDPLVVEVSTSSEPNFIKSAPLALASTPTTVVTPNEEYKNSFISCRTPLPDGEKLKVGTDIKLNFPEGFKLPASIIPANVSVMGVPTKALAVERNTFKITLPTDVEYFIAITVRAQAGVTNPKAGTYSFSITTPKDTYDCGQIEIIPTKGLVSNLVLSNYQSSLESKYSFKLTPSSQAQLAVGDIFRVEFPEGTILPRDFDLAKVTVGGKTAISTGVNGTTLAIATPIEITSIKPADVSIDIGIQNPRKHGSYNLKVYVDQGEPMVSEEYVLEPAPLKSWIYFLDPDKPNCGDWFNKPPILGFDCLNPDAKITFWFNNQPDKSVTYGGEARLMPGSQRAKITWQAEFNGVKEEPQTYNLNIDTVTPPLTLNYPKSNASTSSSSFFVSGERGFTEMLTDGDNEKYQVTDSVFVRFEGKETQLLQGEIYETKDQDSIEYKFQHTITLKEGPNVIEVIARDQACNETIIKRVITLDTEPPRFEVLSPKENEVFTEGDSTTIRVKTEANAMVYIDKTLAVIESTEGDTGIFSANVTLDAGKNIFVVSAKDVCGNTTSMNLVITAKPKKTVIVLTLDKKEWTVNGAAQYPLTTPPTSKFTDLRHKALNGTTYMPIRDIADLLNCTTEWDAKEKKMILNQHLPNGNAKVIECWLNKTVARIDGKEVKYNAKGTLYPVSINGKTMLPLRFVAENLGASVVFDAKTKQITLTYPK